MNDPHNVLDKVSRSLGRSSVPSSVPPPPTLNEPIVRLVLTDIGLPALFEKKAKENKISVHSLRVESLHEELIKYLHEKSVKSVMIPSTRFLERLEIKQALTAAGFKVRSWDEMSLDETYDIDASVTDVWKAVAETGSLVIRASTEHGRAMSLVPPIHIAIVEPKNCVGDLIDLFETTTKEGTGSATMIISGPSKTSDIEMNLVTGVHGPVMVQFFLLK